MKHDQGALISVIIPVYNGENYLREAIESVLAQTYPNYELYVVDDGSTDSTASIAQSFGSRLTYVHQENQGAASAFNNGLCLARGKYIAWLSHDEVYLPEKLEKQVGLMEEMPNVGACVTYYNYVNAAGEVIQENRTEWYPHDRMLRELMRRIFPYFGTIVFRRRCIDAIGNLDEQFGLAADAEMLIRLFRSFDMALIPEFLHIDYVHPAQQSVVSAQRARRDSERMYAHLLRDLPLEELFPELSGKPVSGKDVARARYWLGDAMCFEHQYHRLAWQQYLLGLKSWPDVRNPAYKRLPVLLYLASRRWLGSQVRNLRAWSPKRYSVDRSFLLKK